VVEQQHQARMLLFRGEPTASIQPKAGIAAIDDDDMAIDVVRDRPLRVEQRRSIGNRCLNLKTFAGKDVA